jgi:hypothetical protein
MLLCSYALVLHISVEPYLVLPLSNLSGKYNSLVLLTAYSRNGLCCLLYIISDEQRSENSCNRKKSSYTDTYRGFCIDSDFRGCYNLILCGFVYC